MKRKLLVLAGEQALDGACEDHGVDATEDTTLLAADESAEEYPLPLP